MVSLDNFELDCLVHAITNYSGFESSFDDSFLSCRKATESNKGEDSAFVENKSSEEVTAADEQNETTNSNESNMNETTNSEQQDSPKKETSVIVIDESEMSNDYSNEMKEYLKVLGAKEMLELLPKLPTTANGMKLLGVPELNPLYKSGEVYKLRLCRPDFPIGFSETWDDRTTLRMTNYAKLVSEDVQMTNFRIEIASLVPGIQDDDIVGIKGMTELYEATDVCTLTMKPFIQRKVSGKSSTAGEPSTIKLS